MTDTARVLLTAAALSALTMSGFAWQLTRLDPSQTERLIGELRLAQWGAMLLAGTAAMPIGLALSNTSVATGPWEAAIGVVFVGVAGMVLQRDPREALLVLSAAFVLHALVDVAHRPGWLSPDLAPRWYTAGCAVYDVYLAAVCYWARRR